jgi:hypothetical protein
VVTVHVAQGVKWVLMKVVVSQFASVPSVALQYGLVDVTFWNAVGKSAAPGYG